MSLNFKSIIESIGKNNKPTYAVMAVAVANGIFKPLASLTDKKEAPETKKYAALREFMTEVVAVPTYWACGELASKVAGSLFKDQPLKQPMAKTNMGFLGVCLAALFVIPGLCSIVVKPFTNMIYKYKKDDAAPKLDIISESEMPLVKPIDENVSFNNNLYTNYTMEAFTNRGGLKI